jgi:muramoyltetrapeptide carboxypeptidase
LIMIFDPQNPKRNIRVIAPAGPVNQNSLQKGILFLEEQGFIVSVAGNVNQIFGHLAGIDELRARETQAAFCDPDVDFVWAARGGFGCIRMLDLLDWDKLSALNSPPLLIGYSDLTSLQCALYQKLGWLSLHGPMVASELSVDLDERSWRSLSNTLGGEFDQSFKLDAENILHEGINQGRLLGGNLSVLTSLLGTPWYPDFTDAVLFIEDHGEYPFRMDRYLAQLKNSGTLDKLKGILIGHFNNCEEPDTDKSTFSVNQLFEQYFDDLRIPVVRGIEFGHSAPRITIPFGGICRINTRTCSLEFAAE